MTDMEAKAWEVVKGVNGAHYNTTFGPYQVALEALTEAHREGQANPSPACSACGVYKGPVCGCDKQPGEVTGTEDEATTLPPAAVARVLREAADRAESFCKSKCEGCAACQISEAIEAMIPERERHETR